MTPTPPELRRRRLALALLALSMLAMSDLRDRPVIGTLSLSFDLDRAPRVEAVLTPPLATAAALLADVADRLIR
ncbi:hypothetical protein [Sphingomonas adhaesiva]|uniref:hypothetical protein n=1 Tax=Sphingomonas adhaesiva TaxID=28212 RepID=UPI002FFA6AEB